MNASQYVVRIVVTVVLVVAIAELSKRSSLAGALLASVPITSVLAMVWLYTDTRDVAQVAQLSKSVFWLVLPSLALFLVLPALLQRGLAFYASLTASIGATVVVYFAALVVARAFGVRL
jgi:hypothetical protein